MAEAAAPSKATVVKGVPSWQSTKAIFLHLLATNCLPECGLRDKVRYAGDC